VKEYNFLGMTGGAGYKVSDSLARAAGRSWVQVPAAILARLENKYLLKSLMVSSLYGAFVLDYHHECNQKWGGHSA